MENVIVGVKISDKRPTIVVYHKYMYQSIHVV